jgi:glycosyltransferase involved in cell wall biosynthesis
MKSLWIRLIEQRSLIESAGVHATAEFEAAEIKSLGLRLPEIFCVPNGVSWPAELLTLAAGPYAGVSRPYALFLSRIDPKKGLDRLIEAWRWVPDLPLLVAGNDEEGYQKKLEKLADEHRVRERVIFLGLVSDEHKWALYENAMMFILPSYSENFGNVVAEAMAMGCPVVVTAEVGLAKLVNESQSGVVSDGAPQKLAESVTALMRDASRRKLMGERGRLTARRYLSWEGVAVQMENLYLKICKSGGSRKLSGSTSDERIAPIASATRGDGVR